MSEWSQDLTHTNWGSLRSSTLPTNWVVILLLMKRYNLYKVLACSNTFFQLPLFCATFFQLLIFMFFISSKRSSSKRVLGLPIGLLDMDFHLLIFCTILSSAMRSTWPNQFNLCFLINPIIFCPFNIPFTSWLVLIIQQPSTVLVGRNIFLMIFLSQDISLFVIFSISTHVSESYWWVNWRVIKL